MASGVNVKMGVSGVSQFRSEINKVKQSLKTVDEALKLNEKEFKATGDAEAYMQTKTELLKVKLEEQKSVLATAEKALQDMTDKGVDKASKAFQEMQRQVLQAKGAMLDTENALAGVSDAGDSAADGVSEMNAQLARVGEGISWQNVTDGLSKITGGLENIIKKAWNAGKALVNATLGAGQWADELKTTAAQYEIDPEDLQRWRATSAIIDTDVDTILSARDKLKKGREKNDKEVMGALAYLGIDPTGKDDMTIFWEAGEAIARLGSEEDKVEYANRMFGRSWRELLPLFTAGRKEWEETNASWSVVDNEHLDALGDMDDAYQKMNQQFEILKMTALSEFAEPMQKAMEVITEKLGEFTEWLKSDEGQAFVDNIISKVQAALEWIADPKNMQSVLDGIKWLAAGWAAIKLGGGAADMLKLINGLKGLGGGSGSLGGLGAGGGGGGSLVAGGGGGGGIIGGLKGLAAGNGLSLLTPAAVLAAAVLPAELARGADERRWDAQKERWSAGAGNLTGGDREFLLAAAAVMDEAYRPSGKPGEYLMGLKDRSDLQLMQLHNMVGSDNWTALQEYWRTGGENMADFQVNQLFQDVADAYTRMAEMTADVTGTSEKQVQSNSEMTEAAKGLKGLGGDVANAVSKALNGAAVYINGTLLTEKVGEMMAITYSNN